MGWFLLRKPYPEQEQEQRIDVLNDEMLFGRGKECSVHCLSIFVSRIHLRIIPKSDGGVHLVDLGSSNGTFINETKVTPQVEVPLFVGDEIGMGNIHVENKDCFVYKVCYSTDNEEKESHEPHNQENTNESGSANQKQEKPEIKLLLMAELESELHSKVKSTVEFDGNPAGEVVFSANEGSKQPLELHNVAQHCLERGLKRFAVDEPDIIVLDDDGDCSDINVHKRIKIGELERLKNEPDGANQTSYRQDDKSVEGTYPGERRSSSNQSPFSSNDMKDSIAPDKTSNFVNTVTLPDTTGEMTRAAKTHDDVMMPPPQLVPISLDVKSEQWSNDGSLPKPVDRHLSALLENTSDTSTIRISLSSPLPVMESLSTSSNCSTPTVSKHFNLDNNKSILTSTPCVVKSENATPSSTRNEADFSPIINHLSRRLQESPGNYTLEEEMIELSGDEDDEIFPCSQMFAEDVKPNVEDLNKEPGIIELSDDEEPERNKVLQESELDDLVLISSDDDEEEDDILSANNWYKRLSQSFVKVEEDHAGDENDHVHRDEKNKDDGVQSFSKKFWDYDSEFDELQREKKKDLVRSSEIDSKTEISMKLVGVSKDTQKSHNAEVAPAKESEKPKGEKRDKRKEKKRKHEEKERRKEKDIHDRHRKTERSPKRKSYDKRREGKGDKHRRKEYDSKRKTSRDRDLVVKKLQNTFGTDTSNEDEPIFLNTEKGGASESFKLTTQKQGPSPFTDKDSSTSRSAFDDLLLQGNERRQPLVTLKRLEDQPDLCKDLTVNGPQTRAAVPPLPPKKAAARKIELVDALPNPPRKASNRGISCSTAFRTFHGEKTQNLGIPKSDKPAEIKDQTKALRKEKLAKVAALHASREKGNLESKRIAPAKIKVTASNRGSFLTEGDEKSPTSKPKSRKDIVENMKIPKLKDKPATDLPTKSPLQAMNMSWEKDMPEVVAPPPVSAPPSIKSSGPVEIPTGRQPKQRHAQVPHPGFFADTNFVPDQIPTLKPVKSCLSGSSKHNIAMNDLNPVRQKKRVRFKENLTEIRYIERCVNARPVSSLKSADRPTPLAMSQVPAARVSRVSSMQDDEQTLQDVIYDISKWNPLWLREEKDLPKDVLPPVVSNMNLPAIPRTEFLDFDEYHNTMYPLLMLELWNGVSKEYGSNDSDSRGNNIMMAVDHAVPCEVISKPDRKIATLNCHMIIDERGGGDHPRLGYLVIVDLLLKDPAGKLVVNPVFGYVSHDSKDSLKKHDLFHKDLLNHCRNPAFKVRFSLLIRERKNYTYFLDKPMRVKNVKYIRGDLRVFQAIKNLDYMPLKYSIISPSAANEDFTLPDISKKTLAFADQLNATQERIVLQTAEVCQQDKPKICLLQGPPGTGKSHVIASLVIQLLYRDGLYCRANRERGLVPRILLCAPSNNAVDLLVRRLLRRRAVLEKQHRFKMVRVGQVHIMHPDVKGVSLQELAKCDVVRQGQAANDPSNIMIDQNTWAAKLCSIENLIHDMTRNNKPIPQDLIFRQADINRRLKVLDDRLKQQSMAPPGPIKQNSAMEREASKKILRGADIVATTLNSCGVRTMENVFPPLEGENQYHFQVCIVDEATQCLEVETLIPLLMGVKTLILVGDPNQLPATILSKVAREKGLGTSLFARLQATIPGAIQLLETQYRMHPDILRWPNKFFYNRRLKSPEHMASCRNSNVMPYSVISLPFVQEPRGEVNKDEARFVLLLAELLLERKAVPQQDFKVGIVTPYQSQRRVISSMLQERAYRDLLEVNTIDSFQGQERDVVIISCVRTNGVGFLSDRQRINVALTRAKYALYICGNFSSLDRDSMWNNLLNDARQRKCYLDVQNHQNKEELWNLIKRK